MKKSEVKKVMTMLNKFADRFETIGGENGGYYITVYWLSGGQD